MKYKFFIIIVFFLAMGVLPTCSNCLSLINTIDIIQFNHFATKLNSSGDELDVSIDIQSVIEDNAYLILRLGKEYPDIHAEGFSDSLLLDGFHVRSYYLTDDYCLKGIGKPVDYPVYFKKIILKKGMNKEAFKILFPRNINSIAEFVNIDALVLRYNKEIISKIEEYSLENFGGLRKEMYFETFPDSTSTSYLFTENQLLRNYTVLSGDFPVEKLCDGKSYTPSYYNCVYLRFFLKH